MKPFSLPPETIAELQQNQRDLSGILNEFDKAEECGVDCQLMRQLHSQASDRIGKILNNYGPNPIGNR